MLLKSLNLKQLNFIYHSMWIVWKSNIWNLIPGCLMWIVWLEQNRCSFENMEKTLDELKVLSQRSLFEWSRCWGFIESSSLLDFLFSLRLTIWLPSPLFGCLFLLFLVVHHHEQLVLFIFYLLIIVLWLPIKKKKKFILCIFNTTTLVVQNINFNCPWLLKCFPCILQTCVMGLRIKAMILRKIKNFWVVIEIIHTCCSNDWNWTNWSSNILYNLINRCVGCVNCNAMLVAILIHFLLRLHVVRYTNKFYALFCAFHCHCSSCSKH